MSTIHASIWITNRRDVGAENVEHVCQACVSGSLALRSPLLTIELGGTDKILSASENLVDSFRVADIEKSLARGY